MKKDELIFLALAATALGASLSYEAKSDRFHPRPTSAQSAAVEALTADAPVASTKP